jgi:hypothetical protein
MGLGNEGAICGRPAYDHWMNSPSIALAMNNIVPYLVLALCCLRGLYSAELPPSHAAPMYPVQLVMLAVLALLVGALLLWLALWFWG